jgi:hypothetical protein
MNYVNLTPHVVRLSDGREFPPVAPPARVAQTHTEFDENLVCETRFGQVANLPEPQPGTMFIVSILVANATKRSDVVAPATGHPDVVRRDGQIWSVPGFVRAN